MAFIVSLTLLELDTSPYLMSVPFCIIIWNPPYTKFGSHAIVVVSVVVVDITVIVDITPIVGVIEVRRTDN